MRIEKHTAPDTIIAELGSRLARCRIESGMTQAQTARRAGMGKRTLERIEAGKDTQLSTLIRLLSVLDLTEHLDLLIPAEMVSPMDMLELKGRIKQRKRAAPGRTGQTKEPWKWGDEK